MSDVKLPRARSLQETLQLNLNALSDCGIVGLVFFTAVILFLVSIAARSDFHVKCRPVDFDEGLKNGNVNSILLRVNPVAWAALAYRYSVAEQCVSEFINFHYTST